MGLRPTALSALVLCVLVTASHGQSCKARFNHYKKFLDECNKETKKLEKGADRDIDRLKKRYSYQQCYLKELNKEWATVKHKFRTGNKYLRPQLFLQVQSNESLAVDGPSAGSSEWNPDDSAHEVVDFGSGDPDYDHEYYYGDQGPVPDPECVCHLKNKCKCIRSCQLLAQSCKARFKSTRVDKFHTWKRYKRMVGQQSQRIRAMEENIRRTRAANCKIRPDECEPPKVMDASRTSKCSGEVRIVR